MKFIFVFGNILPVILTLIFSTVSVAAQADDQKINSEPKKAAFITSDTGNFWRAFDLAQKKTDRAEKIAIFEREYLEIGYSF